MNFTSEQENRIDDVYAEVSDFLRFMTNDDSVDCSIEHIGNLTEDLVDVLNHYGYRVYFPWHMENEDGSEEIFDYYEATR